MNRRRIKKRIVGLFINYGFVRTIGVMVENRQYICNIGQDRHSFRDVAPIEI
jgi:hypothetical protein